VKPATHKHIRDWVIAATAIGLIIVEAIRDNGPRPSLLALYATMLGFPAFLQYDRSRKK
jgi:predicted RND superfamily exporter protein